MTAEEQPREGHEEQEAHGATPPHGDELGTPHPETGGPHEHGSPSEEDDTATPPHGDPLR
jgi:hypothetical protein